MLDNGEKIEIEGNKLIFFIFSVCNICLLVIGIVTTGISIYLIILTSGINAFDLLMLLIGVLIFANALFGFKVKTSIRWSLIYSMIISFLLISDIILTVEVIYYKELILNWVIEEKGKNSNSSLEELKKMVSRNISIINDLLLLVLFLLVKRIFI